MEKSCISAKNWCSKSRWLCRTCWQYRGLSLTRNYLTGLQNLYAHSLAQTKSWTLGSAFEHDGMCWWAQLGQFQSCNGQTAVNVMNAHTGEGKVPFRTEQLRAITSGVVRTQVQMYREAELWILYRLGSIFPPLLIDGNQSKTPSTQFAFWLVCNSPRK